MNDIWINCADCGARRKIESYWAGKRICCGNCQAWWWVEEARRGGVLVWSPVYGKAAVEALSRGAVVRLGGRVNLDALGLDRNGRRGPNGRELCHWCRTEVPKGRRSWCGDECVADYKMHHDWGTIRAAVLTRDRGVCAACGVDTVAARKWWRRLFRHLLWREMDEAIKVTGWPSVSRDWWEADHVNARKDGGEDHPRNLRTLCVPCHKARTKLQHAQWAAERRGISPDLFSEAVA